MVVLTNFPPPQDGVHHTQDHTAAFIADKNLGNGKLFIAESRLSWVGGDDKGFSLEYPGINLHAISRDTSAFPNQCLYLMVDGNLQENPDTGMNSGSEEENEPDCPVTEIRFVPEDAEKLEIMYTAMSECQLLHPDPNDTDSEAEEDGYYEGDGDEHELSPEAQARLQHYDNLLSTSGPGGDTSTPAEMNGHQNGHTNETEESEPMDSGQFDDVDMQ